MLLSKLSLWNFFCAFFFDWRCKRFLLAQREDNFCGLIYESNCFSETFQSFGKNWIVKDSVQTSCHPSIVSLFQKRVDWKLLTQFLFDLFVAHADVFINSCFMMFLFAFRTLRQPWKKLKSLKIALKSFQKTFVFKKFMSESENVPYFTLFHFSRVLCANCERGIDFSVVTDA